MTSDQERIERLEQRVSQLIDIAKENKEAIQTLSEAGTMTADIIEKILKRIDKIELTRLVDRARLYKEGKA